MPGHDREARVSFDGLPDAVEPGDPIFLADGRIRLRAKQVGPSDVICEVEAGGSVASHQGVNLPGAVSGMPAAGEADMDWVEFAIDQRGRPARRLLRAQRRRPGPCQRADPAAAAPTSR